MAKPAQKLDKNSPAVLAEAKHVVRRRLSQEEWEKRSLELAAKQAEIDELQNQASVAKSRVKVANELRDALLEQVSILARVIRDKEEDVLEDCQTVADWELGEAVTKVVSTGLVVERRPLTMEERQGKLL